MNSYDTNRDGIIELDQFRKVIIEFFPILTALEVNILCNMAKNISVAEVKELKDREHDDKKYISYYHLIMQIEKYYTYEKANSE